MLKSKLRYSTPCRNASVPSERFYREIAAKLRHAAQFSLSTLPFAKNNYWTDGHQIFAQNRGITCSAALNAYMYKAILHSVSERQNKELTRRT